MLPTKSLRHTASWVIVRLSDCEVMFETFDADLVDKLNVNKYKAVPILEHLQGINEEPLT